MSSNTNREVFITAAGAFMPGPSVNNEEIENYIGRVNGKKSKTRGRVLKMNGIESRHYAMTADGKQTHLNEELCALAIIDALRRRGLPASDIEMLAVATTLPDMPIPGFASMVHGRLGGGAMEILSAGGVCAASMGAMKAACTSVRAGEHSLAVAAGSELSSAVLKASRFDEESKLASGRETECDSYRYLNADFLRWMLSDGAGAVVIEPKPRKDALSLRVEWISLTSYAHEFDTCMYMGCSNPSRPAVGNTWLSKGTVAEAERDGMLIVRQDTQLLARGITTMLQKETQKLFDEGKIVPEEIDHFMPHISSYFFYEQYLNGLKEIGVPIAEKKWFTNLKTKGNTGAASIYIMMEEALNNGRFKPGDRILAMVPESGRFTVSYALFTCVGP